MTRFIPYGLVWLVMWGVSVVPAEAQTLLRWKFKSGDVFRLTMIQETTTTMQFGAQPVDTNLVLTVDSVWTVGKVDPQAGAEITQTVPRMRMKMASPLIGGSDVDTDSPGESANPMAKALKQFTTARFSFQMSPAGEISNIKVTDAAGKPMAAEGPVGQILGKDGIANMVKQTTFALPKQAVRLGETWQQSLNIEVPMLGTMKADTTLTYQGPAQAEGKMLQAIGTETTTSIAQNAGGNRLPQLNITEQSDKGTMYFDNQAGRFSHAESTQNMKLQLMVAGQTVEQTVKTVRKAQLAPAAPQ
ncbi:MAG: DUF6263 family protein [Pirellulaceae bacterium]